MALEEHSSPGDRFPNDLVSQWEIEIRRVLDGERDHAIRRLGSAREYLESVLAQSNDLALSRTAFRKALRNIVQEWQPTNLDPERPTARMLDLIQAYTPVSGDIKILGYMKRWGRFGTRVSSPTPREVDLHLQALALLEKYYQLAPDNWEENRGPFYEYAELLEDDLRDAEYSGHAAARLIELRLLDPEDTSVRRLVKANPSVLHGLISRFLRSPNREKSAAVITSIYEHCLVIGNGLPNRFEEEVVNYGGRFEPDASIHIRGDVIFLNLSRDAERKHVIATWNRDLHFEPLKDVFSHPSNHSEASTVLTEIYEECIQLGDILPGEFEEEIAKHGAHIDYSRPDGPVVVVGEGIEVPLRLSKDALENYTIQIRLASQSDKVDALDSMLKSLSAGSNGGM